MTKVNQLRNIIEESVNKRVRIAIDDTVEEAKKSLENRLKFIAVDVAIDVNQSSLMEELTQEIRLVVQVPPNNK